MLVIYLTVLVTVACILKHTLHKYYQRHHAQYYHTLHSTGAQNASRYPHLDPFLGLDLAIQTWRDFQRGQLSEGMRRRHLQHGRTFAANCLGAECIFTIEPDNIRAVTTHAFDKFGKAAWVAEAAKHVGHGVLLNEGPAWKHSRTMLKPIFHRSALDEPTLLEPHVRRLVATMRALSRTSERPSLHKGEKGKASAFDFHELASMFTLDVVTEFLFGKSTLCLQSPRKQDGQDGVHFLSLVRDFEGPSGEFIAVGPLAWLGLAPSYRRLIRLVDGMKAFFKRKLNDIIEETEPCGSSDCNSSGGGEAPQSQSQSHSPSVFRSMKAAGASDEQIQGEVQNIFFASYDTTSAFLANVMQVLIDNPGIQLRLRREIGVLGGRSPTNIDLAGLEYLRFFLMEALRLYSPVSSHSRTARVDTVLPRGGGGDSLSPLVVRAGATVVWSTYSLNRDPRRYGSDWATFRPERWATLCGGRNWLKGVANSSSTTTTTVINSKAVGVVDEASLSRPACKGATALTGGVGDTTDARDSDEVGQKWRDFFMPFGSGPRSCLGQQMVQSEVAYVIVRLLQEFQEIRAGVDDVQDRAEPRRPFREAKAVSFYNANGVVISVE